MVLTILPGTSGILTPFGKIDGFMFDNKPEPDFFIEEFIKDCRRQLEEDGKTVVFIDFGDDINSYYEVIMNMEKFQRENMNIQMTSRDQPELIVTKEYLELTNDEGIKPIE